MGSTDRLAVLIGHTGLLGRALESALRQSDRCYSKVVVLPHRQFVVDVLAGRGATTADRLLAAGGRQDWFCAAGCVDQNASDLDALNHVFPLTLHDILAARDADGKVRFITFGSALEGRAGLAQTQGYLASKLRLYDALSKRHMPGWKHIRLHTLYGGNKLPHPSMFAGQMYAALASGTNLRMSGGLQLREYHHVDDIALSIIQFLCAGGPEQLIDLSSGEPVRLRDLAVAIFTHFRRREQLEVGAVGHSEAEIFENGFQATPFLAARRDPIEGMIAWFDSLGVRRPA